MKINDLKINGEITYYGTDYVILAIEPPELTLKRKDKQGDVLNISFFDLIKNPSFHAGKDLRRSIENEQKAYFSVLDSLDEKKREGVSERLRIIRPILLLEKIKDGNYPSFVEFHENYQYLLEDDETLEKIKQEELIERIAEMKGISSRTIKRYLSKYRNALKENQQFGEEGLVPESGSGYKYRSDNKTIIINHPSHPELILDSIQIRLEEVYINIIKEVIEKEYLTIHRKSVNEMINLIEIKCLAKEVKPLKPSTLYKIFQRISPKVVERMRYGAKSINKYEEVERGFANNEALYPLHLVEIDHTRMDIEVIDNKNGLVKGRPWITLGIDVNTRMVWCMYISFEPPSANRVRKAIQHGVLFKNTKEQFGTFNDWEMYGIPNKIQFDNGKEFNNYEIKRLVNETLMSNIRFRPIATPRYGGTIERLIGTVNTQVLHNLEGTTKSNIFHKGDYDSSENALLTLEDVRFILTKYITDIYHFQKHKGLPLDCNSPMARFHEGLKKRGFPEFVDSSDEDDFKIALLPTKYKPYTRDGVRLDNVIYRDNSLSHMIDKREKKYLIKYDIDDISFIYIKPPSQESYVRVNAVSPSFESLQGLNRFTYKLLLKHLRETGELNRNKLATKEQITEAKAALQKEVEKAYKKNRRTRQQLERMEWDIEVRPKQQEGTYQKTLEPTYEQLLENAKKSQSNLDNG
ncbi:Mu transposase C-terminal domain-containing protein [Terrihalobacillus insolitus]|uniref:Mu transposase C-terminal domain-containing protein n=1 Tax=Terrihalobacillus insolitus TaxID=2950438 RepID=UPI0023409880|nr:Mu transposase C-terminal domain-containing protein [Terrihalobacillus insolitus]MDC3414771.1 hypothetical protein [Terrihalobacillus insolitus]